MLKEIQEKINHSYLFSAIAYTYFPAFWGLFGFAGGR